MQGMEAGLGADWENGSGDVVGDGVGPGGVFEEEEAEVQTRTEEQIWTVVWKEFAGCAAIVGW